MKKTLLKNHGMTLIGILIAMIAVGFASAFIAGSFLNANSTQKRIQMKEANLGLKREVEFIMKQGSSALLNCGDLFNGKSINASNLTSTQIIDMPSFGSPAVELSSIHRNGVYINSIGIRLISPLGSYFKAAVVINPGDSAGNPISFLKSHEIEVYIKIVSNQIIACRNDIPGSTVTCASDSYAIAASPNGTYVCDTLPNILDQVNTNPSVCGLGCKGRNCRALDGGPCTGENCITNGFFCDGALCRAKGTHPCTTPSNQYPPGTSDPVQNNGPICAGVNCCVGTTITPDSGCPDPNGVTP